MNSDKNIKFENIYDSKMPFFINDFLSYTVTIQGKSYNTIIGYKNDLTLFFRFMKLYKSGQLNVITDDFDISTVAINEITITFVEKITLQDMYAFMSFTETFRNNGSCARARKTAALKSFYKYICSKAKLIIKNPAFELDTPKIGKRNPVHLSLSESKELLSAVLNNAATSKSELYIKKRDYCIITFFLNCGMRLSELCSINISKIKDDTLYVVGKGNKERTIYLNNACLIVLNDYINERLKIKEKIKPEDSDALFISRNFRRINKRSIELLVKKYLGLAGIDNLGYTPHKLRHTAATLMYKYGNVDIRSLQMILGHKNVSTTQIYTHVDDEKLREAVSLNPLNKTQNK